MLGRYGQDQLSRFMSVFSLALIVLALVLNNVGTGLAGNILWWIGLAIIIVCYFRMFSRNTSKRYSENVKYLTLKNKFLGWFKKKGERIKQSKTHRFFKCPECGVTVRTPKGKGKIRITCPKCGVTFFRNS
jgi:predicted RNA-binding Zn-ribbon protein involved in translation (DUF1610 family)